MNTHAKVIVVGGLVILAAVGWIMYFTNQPKQQVVQAPEPQAVKPAQELPRLELEETLVKPPAAQKAGENIKPVEEKQVSAPAAVNAFPYASFRDFGSRFRNAARLSNAAERWKAFREMGINLSDDDFARVETVVKAFQDRDPWGKMRPDMVYQGMLVNAWLEKDPAALANWACALSKIPGDYAISCSETMVFNNGKYEYQPDATVNDGGDAKDLYTKVMKKWAVLDPQAATAWAHSNLPDGAERQSALALIELGSKKPRN